MMLNGLTSLAAAWGEYYGDHTLLQTGVTFAHIGGLVVSGGIALASDRIILQSRGASMAERTLRLADLRRVHRTVIVGLGVVFASGLALFFADFETFVGSWLYWVKMGLLLLLLGNGLQVLRVERALDQNPESAPAWRRMRQAAAASIALWLLITLLGTALVNMA